MVSGCSALIALFPSTSEGSQRLSLLAASEWPACRRVRLVLPPARPKPARMLFWPSTAQSDSAARSDLSTSLQRRRAETQLFTRWLVDVSFSDPLAIYQVAIDAHTGAIRGHRPTLFEARANVYPTNPSISDVEEVELLGLYSGATELTGSYGRVVSCDELDEGGFGGGVTCTEKSHHAEADAEGNFLFEPDPGSSDDPFAEAQMYYHLDLVARWFDEEQGFDHDYPTEAVVNFDYNNAFFGDIDGDGLGEIAFGQSGTMDFAYDADVIYHEFGHSVFGRIAGQTGFAGADEYGFEWATGGLNEGTADLFSLVLTLDPKLGEYAASGFGLGAAIRDLEEDRHCPTDLYGESHRDGEIFGSFGWNLIENPEFGADLTGDYIYGAVAAFPSGCELGRGRRSTGQHSRRDVGCWPDDGEAARHRHRRIGRQRAR